jgi:hypothetical protein
MIMYSRKLQMHHVLRAAVLRGLVLDCIWHGHVLSSLVLYYGQFSFVSVIFGYLQEQAAQRLNWN